MPLKHDKVRTGGTSRIILTIIAAIVFTIIIAALEVSTQSRLASDMLDAFCGGNRNFVVGSHPHLEVIWSTKATPDTGTVWSVVGPDDGRYVGKSMNEIISGGNVTMSQELPSIAALQERLSLRMSQLPDVLFTCSDSTTEQRKVYWQSLKQSVAITPKSCADVQDYCDISNNTGIVARMLCPQTCGCDSLVSGQAFAVGCPKEQCKTKNSYWHALEDVPCNDTAKTSPPGPLWNNWTRYWNASHAYWKDQLTAGIVKEAVENLKLAERALKNGCEGVKKDRKKLCESTVHVTEPMFLPINAFCPSMCDCVETPVDSCPMSCGTHHDDWEDHIPDEESPEDFHHDDWEDFFNYEDFHPHHYYYGHAFVDQHYP